MKTKLKEDDEFKNRNKYDFVTQIKSMSWGEQHGLILTKKGQIFSMGRSISGVLGLTEDEDNDK